jgi:hypothetical protein
MAKIMNEKKVFEDMSKVISVLNKHMDEETCVHNIRTIISEVFEE